MATENTARWSAELEARLRSTFPEDTEGHAFYAICRWDCGNDWQWDTDPSHLARADPLLDVQLSPMLKARGLWEGLGFLTLINDPVLYFYGLSDDERWGVICHEWCHWLDTRNDNVTPIAMQEVEFVERLWRACEAAPGPTDPPPWRAHELRFHRAILHAMDRTGLTSEQLHAFERYGLSPADQYQSAFAGEFGTRRPIRSILNDPVPQAAQELWAADQAKWFAGQPGQMSLPMVGGDDSKKGE